jgi:hypothetical protein
MKSRIVVAVVVKVCGYYGDLLPVACVWLINNYGPSTQQQFFFSFSSDVTATTCFGHTTIIRWHTVVYSLKLFAWLAITLSWICNQDIETLETMHRRGRGLFRGRWWPLGPKKIQYFHNSEKSVKATTYDCQRSMVCPQYNTSWRLECAVSKISHKTKKHTIPQQNRRTRKHIDSIVTRTKED